MRTGNLDLLDPPCGIRQGLLDVIKHQVWVGLKDLVERLAGGDQADHDTDRHSRTSNAGFATHDVDIPGDAVELGHVAMNTGEPEPRQDQRLPV